MKKQPGRDPHTRPVLRTLTLAPILAFGLGMLQPSLPFAQEQKPPAPMPPIHFKKLQTFLPTPPGYEKGELGGETIRMEGISLSTASVELKKGDLEFKVTITDSAFFRALPQLTFALGGEFERETSDEYEKTVKVRGYPGYEKYDKKEKTGELLAYVGNRFLVEVEGNSMEDPKVLWEIMGLIDLPSLAKLK